VADDAEDIELLPTPIENHHAGIDNVRFKKGPGASVLSFTVEMIYTARTRSFFDFLAGVAQAGAVVTIRPATGMLWPDATEEPAADNASDSDKEGGSSPLPGAFDAWPKSCGLKVKTHGMNTICDDGHVTNTPAGEPCNRMDNEAGSPDDEPPEKPKRRRGGKGQAG